MNATNNYLFKYITL
jgi:hypothetical protein